MKFLTSLTITIALTSPLLVQTPTQTPTATEAQVKQELNEAAKGYREGRFAEAQVHAERALLLDPQNKLAPMYVARIIHAQYKHGDFTPENVAKAREAIVGYQRILERNPGDDETYKAIAYLYGAIKEDELMREWVFQRASNVLIADDNRAEAFVALASTDWDCSFKITELPDNKVSTVKGNKVSISYRMPKARVEFERANECAQRGLEMARLAITLTPENEQAWSYKTNILLELAKLAEMSEETQQRTEFYRQYEEALKQTTKLSKSSESKP